MTKIATGGHPDLKMVNPAAAAIDIGSTMHMAAVNPDACETPVRAFGTFTQDLHDLADWFKSRCISEDRPHASQPLFWTSLPSCGNPQDQA
jgi:hypothetical protein